MIGEENSMHIEYSTYLAHEDKKDPNESGRPLLVISLADIDGELNEPGYYGIRKQIKPISLALQEHGVRWSERHHGYIVDTTNVVTNRKKLNELFSRVKKVLERYNNGQKIVTKKMLEREAKQSYYSSESIAKYLRGIINCNDRENIILDPAAGQGILIDKLNFPREQIWAVEQDPECCKVLRKKGYIHIINDTFQNVSTKIQTGEIPRPTRIIMNPPFSHQQDLKFFNIACNILEERGIIAAVVSQNSIYEELEKLEIYGLKFDDTDPKTMARNILNSEYAKNLSPTVQEFLRNIMESSFVWFEYALEDSFKNTNVGTFLIELRAKERSIGIRKTDNTATDFER